jgi:DNA-binding CsgD family transcriptional regulator/PAS domain-containing protein
VQTTFWADRYRTVRLAERPARLEGEEKPPRGSVRIVVPCLEGAPQTDDMFRDAPVPVAIVELPSLQLRPNDAFAVLLGLDDPGMTQPSLLELLPEEDRPVVENVFVGLASGLIESCQGRGRVRRPDGAELDVVGWARPFDGARPCRRAVLAVAPAEATRPLAEPWFARVDLKKVVFGMLDHEWRFSEISPDAVELLGWDLEDARGSRMLTLARSSAERRAVATCLRVQRPDGRWTPVRCVLSPLCDHNPARFGFGLWLLSNEDDLKMADQRANRLEEHLWRIGAEVHASGIGGLTANRGLLWSHPELEGLSERQSQVLRRLIKGEQVPAIARSLFLSESTVRNHLSAIYRKIGVHSQSELLARLIGEAAQEGTSA